LGGKQRKPSQGGEQKQEGIDFAVALFVQLNSGKGETISQ